MKNIVIPSALSILVAFAIFTPSANADLWENYEERLWAQPINKTPASAKALSEANAHVNRVFAWNRDPDFEFDKFWGNPPVQAAVNCTRRSSLRHSCSLQMQWAYNPSPLFGLISGQCKIETVTWKWNAIVRFFKKRFLGRQRWYVAIDDLQDPARQAPPSYIYNGPCEGMPPGYDNYVWR